MNYDQAKEYSFVVPWKTMECFSGPECWCRIIVPVESIFYSHTESPDVKHEYIIVDAGALDQTTAEHITLLHNEHCERIKQNGRDVMKEIMDSLIPLEEMAEQFEKLWENKQSKIGKIVRKKVD